MIFTLTAITATKNSTTVSILKIRGFNHRGLLLPDMFLRVDRLSWRVSYRMEGGARNDVCTHIFDSGNVA